MAHSYSEVMVQVNYNASRTAGGKSNTATPASGPRRGVRTGVPLAGACDRRRPAVR